MTNYSMGELRPEELATVETLIDMSRKFKRAERIERAASEVIFQSKCRNLREGYLLTLENTLNEK